VIGTAPVFEVANPWWADVEAVVAHLDDEEAAVVHARAEDAVARGAHYDQSREYRRYLEALEQKPAFSLHSGRSVRYAGPEQLVELGVMRDTPEWAETRGVADALPTAGHGPDPRSPGRSSRRAS